MSISIHIKNRVLNMDDEEDQILDLNISNVNFSTLWSALGFSIQVDIIEGVSCANLYGEVHPMALHKKLESLNPNLVERAKKESGANSIDFGIDDQRVQYYIRKLREIVAVAMKKEENIVWG